MCVGTGVVEYVVAIRVLCVFGGMFLIGICGSKLDRPYVVDVPVASQSADERNKASAQGLQQLLIKLGGQPANDNPVVKQQLASGVDKYILQYSYEKGVASGGYLPVSAFVLRLVFSQTAVLQLLHDAGIALWPLDRPQLLVLMLDAEDALVAGYWSDTPGNTITSTGFDVWCASQVPIA